MDQETISLAIVFAAVASCVWAVWRIVAATAASASGSIDIEEEAARRSGRQKSGVERFVSSGALFRMRLLAAAAAPALFALAAAAAYALGMDGGGAAVKTVICVFAVLAGVAGWFAPLAWYRRKARLRQEEFETRMLDLVSGLANALRAGMAIQQALDRVGAQMEGAMGEEMAIVRRERGMNMDYVDSLVRLEERMPCEDMKLLCAAVRLTSRTGGQLAEVLSEMADTIRNRREFADKVKSLTAQGRFEGLGLGLMPVVAFAIFYAIQPEITSVLFKTARGWCLLGIAGLLEFAGFACIRKIVSVEV